MAAMRDVVRNEGETAQRHGRMYYLRTIHCCGRYHEHCKPKATVRLSSTVSDNRDRGGKAKYRGEGKQSMILESTHVKLQYDKTVCTVLYTTEGTLRPAQRREGGSFAHSASHFSHFFTYLSSRSAMSRMTNVRTTFAKNSDACRSLRSSAARRSCGNDA